MTRRKMAALAFALIGALALVCWSAYESGRRAGMATGVDPGAAPATATAPGPLPQSIAEGEAATRRHMESGIKAGDIDPVTGRKVLYYHDPMVPGNKFDQPARSPFMDMMLVPVYADGGQDQGTVTISPRMRQNLGVRTAEVVEGRLSPEISAVGSIVFNERDQAVVQARATAFVERLFVRATLDRVRKGEALAQLHVPAWIAAQEEFLSLRRMQGRDPDDLLDAARARMRQAGMSDAQIALVERSGTTQPRLTLHAPMSGVVTELGAREGMTVMAGGTLFRINGLASVWAEADVPESQAGLLRPGTRVQASSGALPGRRFDGRVQALLPQVDAATRTRRARLELGNPDGLLVPGMFVQMRFTDMRADSALLVPTEALVRTGRRVLVMVAEEGGHFRPVEVTTGIDSGGQTEIRTGLSAGQRVVVSSQFLIESEASLKGVEARLGEASTAPAAAPLHEGDARIEAIRGDTVTLSHGPVPSLLWDAMTMDFKAPAGGLPPALRPGERVRIEFFMPASGLPQLTQVRPTPVDAPDGGAR